MQNHKNNERENASQVKALIFHAKKVLNYRRHVLGSDVVDELEKGINFLQAAARVNNREQLSTTTQNLKLLVAKHGGDVSPTKILSGYVETFFVAAFLAIGLRTFFIQSFQIPTNSMYPTYHGIQCRVRTAQESSVSTWQRLLRKIFYCSRSIRVVAKNNGEILIPLTNATFEQGSKVQLIMPYEIVKVPKFFGLKRVFMRKYTILVDWQQHNIFTPREVSLDQAMLDGLGIASTTWPDNCRHADYQNLKIFHTGKYVQSGDSIFDFDIIPGDMLFVNKLSCHFRNPKIGESVVFNTDKISSLTGRPKFFIKRLVGRGSNRIKIVDDQLFVDGKLPQGNEILQKLNLKAIGYESGYLADGLLGGGEELSIPKGQLFVLGDNSSNSNDSRYWGFVPETSVCGRPLMIFFPLSRIGWCR